MQDLQLFGWDIPPAIYAPSFIALWVMAWLTIKAFLFIRLRRLTEHTATRLDDLIINALNVPLIIVIVASSGIALVHWTPFLDDLQGHPRLAMLYRITEVLSSPHFVRVATIFAGVIFVDRFLRGLVPLYAERVEFLKTAGVMVQGMSRALVYALGALVLLDSLGISITPILASLGIGSLAVAFALQPTLENFFSGVQLIVDRPILPGHFIRLESGEEGFVERIGFRSTWLRTLPGNMIIIPNKELVGSRVMNYNYPQKDLAVTVDFGVHYDSDLERVERVVLDVAGEIQRTVPGAVRGFQPAVRFHTLGDSSVDGTVAFRAEEFTAGGPIKHAFVKGLLARFAKEGITMPYPVMAINLEQERAGAALGGGRTAG